MDAKGNRHVLGRVEGASENASSATVLLEDLMERGVDPKRRYLFVIDGSKALPATLNRVFGTSSPVQHYRHHNIRSVCNQLPDNLAGESGDEDGL